MEVVGDLDRVGSQGVMGVCCRGNGRWGSRSRL